MDPFGQFETTIDMLIEESKECDKLSSTAILTLVSVMTDMFQMPFDPKNSFISALEHDITVVHIEKSLNALALLMSRVRKRGIAVLGPTDKLNTLGNIIVLEKINNGVLNYVEDLIRKGSKAKFLSGKGTFAYLDDRYECVMEDTKGLLFQLWERYPNPELVREAAQLGASELIKKSLNKYRGPPSELALEDFKCHTVTKKMWLKLDSFSPEILYAVAPHKLCKMCKNVFFTTRYDFIILDLCFHLFCGPCIRSRMEDAAAGYCPTCNKMVNCWISRDVLDDYNESGTERYAQGAEGSDYAHGTVAGATMPHRFTRSD